MLIKRFIYSEFLRPEDEKNILKKDLKGKPGKKVEEEKNCS